MLLSDKVEFKENDLYEALGNISHWQNDSTARWCDTHELLVHILTKYIRQKCEENKEKIDAER